ncbi:hypothetical protein BKI52_40360 [marine bacterium AO1-C]|nr:hypothetical protein BKI52_40360 [marine bacterium AO1-C]
MNIIQMRFLLITGLLLGLECYNHTQAQPVIKLGITPQDGQTWREIMVGYGFELSDSSPYDFFGIESVTLGVAAGIESNDNELSPKVSVGLNTGGPFSLTTSLNINYFGQREQKFAFTPEVGGALLKLLHVTYGYRFNSFRRDGSRGTPHRLSFFLTIPLLWFQR